MLRVSRSSVRIGLLLGIAGWLAIALPTGCASSGSAQRASDGKAMWTGPGFEVSIDVMESAPPQYAVRYETTVPTGGWEMITDKVEIAGGVMMLYITLVEPGRNEIVTQAFATHRGQYLAGRTEIATVNVLARQHVRGSEPPTRYAPAHSVRRK